MAKFERRQRYKEQKEAEIVRQKTLKALEEVEDIRASIDLKDQSDYPREDVKADDTQLMWASKKVSTAFCYHYYFLLSDRQWHRELAFRWL